MKHRPFSIILASALMTAACNATETPGNHASTDQTTNSAIPTTVPDKGEGSGDAAYDEAVASDTPPEGVGNDDLAYGAAESVVSDGVGGSARGQMVDSWIPLMKLCLTLDPALGNERPALRAKLTLGDLALRGKLITKWEKEEDTIFLTSPFFTDSGQKTEMVTSLHRDYSAAPGCPAGTASIISVSSSNAIGSAQDATDMYDRYLTAVAR